MLLEQITSRQNPLIKRAIRIRSGSEPGHLFVEGVRLAEEVLDAGLAIEAFIHTQALSSTDRGAQLLDRARQGRFRGALVPDAILKAICDTGSPQGVAILAAQPRFELADLFDSDCPLVVALDGVQDPGNVGTIVRAAEGAGSSGAAMSETTADPYSPKAIRASMGSAFRLPLVRRARLPEIFQLARTRGLTIVAAQGDGPTSYTDVDWRSPTLIVIGNEASGISKGVEAEADLRVRIPLAPAVESLNAAMAATVLLFEAARRRS